MAKLVGFNAELMFDNFNHPLFKTTTTLKGGTVIQKILALDDFLRLFKVSLKQEKLKYLPVPQLPKYFYKGGVTQKSNTFWVALFVPSCKNQYICAQTKEFFNLAYPSLFFVIKVTNGIVRSKNCFAIADTVCTDNSVLMHYPYGHVATSGDICMGSCSSSVKNFTDAYSFVESFFLGEDAGHYYTPGVMAKPVLSLRELVGKVNEKGMFPREWLIPVKDSTGHELTVKSYLKKFQDATVIHSID